jgi:hypothetical protein
MIIRQELLWGKRANLFLNLEFGFIFLYESESFLECVSLYHVIQSI